MPSLLIKKARPPHSKHNSGAATCQDEEPDSDAFASLVTSPHSAPAAKTNRSTPTKANKATRPFHSKSSSRTTLSLATDGAVNAMTTRSTAATNGASVNYSTPSNGKNNSIPHRMNSTIRTVRSFEEREPRLSEDSSIDSTPPSCSASRNSAFSSSINSNASGISATSQPYPQSQMQSKQANSRIKSSRTTSALHEPASALDSPRGSRLSVEVGRNSIEIPQRESSLSATRMGPPSQAEDANGNHHNEVPPSASDGANGWDSSVGKAGLGKTGRVINKLVSDNESLKREIKIERLRAEESKSTARLLEDKMERMTSDYESQLLEASVTKTLLARKERQVESLQSTVDLERKRAVDAADRERIWKDEMEKVRAEAKQQVEEATNYATLMEGRYNAISSHWKDQGEEVKRKVTKMKADIDRLVAERRQDDDKIGTLRELCDQQDGNIRELRQQKDDIAAQFDKYKREQEDLLRDIKTKARDREEEQERTVAEAKQVLEKLKWALGVKGSVNWSG